MKIDPKWIRVVGIAMGLPSTIFALALVVMKLIEEGILSRGLGWGLFLLVVIQSLSLMVWYALKVNQKKEGEDTKKKD